MWFKNLQIHRFSAPWTLSAEDVEASLAKHAFFPGTSLEMQTQGWASPRDNGQLVHCVNRQMLLVLRTEKKLLPATVVNQVTKARAVELEEQQGFKPGRKQLKELKEQITEELLPRAFSIRRDTRVWIDPVNGWLAIDAAATAKADEVRGMLFKAIDPLPVVGLHVNQSPVAAMTEWLATDTAPAGFTVDQEIELQSSAETKATVRYVRHPLDPEDLRRHIAAGKRCTRLAMTWNDRVSFVLTDTLAVKRVAPLDVIKEQADGTLHDEDERFDADFALMAGELAAMLGDLTDALGGERKAEGAAEAPALATDVRKAA
ncbi:recombination-associated protein RdgC [Cupriavidus sp. RAF12]|uniref:recombination-associated protein RdgC n=1 Tax=Cupriavidus sp. RAF12 TaxID=3233050 RepID=UPI003F8F2ECC